MSVFLVWIYGQFGFIINVAGRILKQGNKAFPLSSEEQAITVRRVTLVSGVVIPPMSEYIAWAQLDSNRKHQQVAMIQPKDETGVDYVITGKTLVITGSRQLVPVRMMNFSDSEKRLCANSYVADCEDVELINDCQADISTSCWKSFRMSSRLEMEIAAEQL